MTASSGETGKLRVLVVQCCHPPQFFYLVEELRRKHPDWDFEALLIQDPQLDYYVRRFPRFQRVHFLGQDLASARTVDRIIFPLLNRGYRRIKKAARSLSSNCWETDYQGNLRVLETKRYFRSNINPLHHPPEGFADYRRQFPLQPLGKKILLLESCHPSLLARIGSDLQRLIPADAQVTRLQHGTVSHSWKQARKDRYDSAIVFFSGEKGFTFMKFLPFLTRVPRTLVVIENGDFVEARVRWLLRFLWNRIAHGTTTLRQPARILLVQTEEPSYVSRVITRLRGNTLFPGAEVVLLCRQEDSAQFESNPDISRLIVYSSRDLRQGPRLWKMINRLDADTVCGIFTGRPSFRKPKLLFLLLPFRRHLVFNASLDCYDLTPRTFWRIFRKEPLLGSKTPDLGPIEQRVLLLQTEELRQTAEVVSILATGEVVAGARVSVFCPRTWQEDFASMPEVEHVHTYDASLPVQSLKTIWKMARSKHDIVAAIFSGRPVFLKHRLLFLLLRGNHLVFNANLDCFYLGWQNLHLILTSSSQIGTRRLLLRSVRTMLFLPRFAYLLLWATILKLRRAVVEPRLPAERRHGTSKWGRRGLAHKNLHFYTEE